MKPIHRILIIMALVVAVGLTLAKRHSTKSVDPVSTAVATSVENALPRLVDLGADKCIPCKAMAPILEDLKREYANTFTVEFIDVWKNPTVAEPYDINLIPTQIFFDAEGNELWRHEGFLAKEGILSKWKELGLEI